MSKANLVSLMRPSLRRFLPALVASCVLVGYAWLRLNNIHQQERLVELLDGRSTLSLYCDSTGAQRPFCHQSMVESAVELVRLPFSELSDVNLSGSKKLTDENIHDLLAHLPDIKHLDLSGTVISDSGIQEIAKLKKLRFVDLSGTNVTKDGLEYLEKAAPGIKINDDIVFRELSDLIQNALPEERQFQNSEIGPSNVVF